ncbi:MAG: carbonic anhydrase [Caulobacter sp.]|nr:carbonic anhydrase [Caulobacter sp.]
MIGAFLAANRRWVAEKFRRDPGEFRRLDACQSPRVFWIGCSDISLPATEMIGLAPGQVFVHANLANMAAAQDANFLSALSFAIDVLGVSQVVVCGHYGCAGVRAALSGERQGMVDHWLQPLRELGWRHAGALDAILDLETRANDLSERHVRRQVASLAANPLVQDAWSRGQPLAIHGLIYSAHDGLLRDLETSVDSGKAAFPLVHGMLPKGRVSARRARPATIRGRK